MAFMQREKNDLCLLQEVIYTVGGEGRGALAEVRKTFSL